MTARQRRRPRGWRPFKYITSNIFDALPSTQQCARSATNWLLDAVCYLRDGDRANACIAAARALRLLMVRR